MLVTKLAAANSGSEWWPIISVSAKPNTIVPNCPIVMGTPKRMRAGYCTVYF